MSKIIKLSDNIEIPNDFVVMELKMTQSGKIMLNAPTLPPNVVCKALFNVISDLMFSQFQGSEANKGMTQ